MSARIRKHIALDSGSNEYRSSSGRNGWTPGAQSPGAQPTSSARSSDVGNSAHREREPVERVKDPELAESLRSAQVDLLLNVHSLYIIHQGVLAVPRLGAYNLHPAPLPRYAGLNSVSWAIYHGEKEHGV